MKRWWLPVLLLAVLVAAFALRWSEESKTTDNGRIFRYLKDRWTGQLWVQRLQYNSASFTPIGDGADDEVTAIWLRDLLTSVWWGVTGLVAAGWGIAAWRQRRVAKSVDR